MNYNTERERLMLPEYGRLVQDMIAYAVGIEERERRTQAAHTIARVMVSMNPQLKAQPDYQQKVWDHMAYISGYTLDIDFPYPINRMGDEAERPESLAYPQTSMKRRQYGRLLEEMMAQGSISERTVANVLRAAEERLRQVDSKKRKRK